MKELTVFDKAMTELTSAQFDRWVCYAYGVLKSGMDKTQEQLLLKAIEQDKKY